MLCIGLRPNIDKDCRALILGQKVHGSALVNIAVLLLMMSVALFNDVARLLGLH